MAAPQNCNYLKSRILEKGDLQNGYPPHLFGGRKLKNSHNVPNNLPQETDRGFVESWPVR